MKKLLPILAVIFITACSPRMKYLGDTYSPNYSELEVYYDNFDIKKQYKTMGILTADSSDTFEKSLDKIRQSMIKEAREKGADAILFTGLYNGREVNDNVVEAKLIRYL